MLPLRESPANLQFGSRKGYIVLVLGARRRRAAGHGVAAALALRRPAAGGARQRGRGARDRRRPLSASSSARSCSRPPSWARAARSTCRCSSTSTRASPSARRPRSRRWSARSSAAWARCGGRCWARSALHLLAELTRNLFGDAAGPEHGDLRHRAGADRDVPAARPGRQLAGRLRDLWRGGRRG